MDRSQVSTAEDAAGKGKQKVGVVAGNKAQQAMGAAHHVRGGLWEKTGTLTQALDKLDKKTR
jgi:uncharacterized protein YjbJ (UPF0337 family)